ncbi:MAG TPA: peptidyl-prolyl cis-trans isomerase [Anaeromyxobacteraceae bacterium]|nr:peptidyl-prolyl cis-trans isomerase [Anaeromyxobacteraceae bacterium]
MTRPSRLIRLLPAALLALPAVAPATNQQASAAAPDAGASAHFKDGRKVPLFAEASGHVPVARTGNEAITLRELADALATAHTPHAGEEQVRKRDPLVILERLVDLRLMVLEARAMGIADLPEYRAQVEAYRATLLRDMLKEGYTRDLKPDSRKIEAIYRDAVRAWKVRSLTFAAEADARELASRMKEGASFEALAAEALAQKKAQGTGRSDVLPEKKMLPEVVAEVRKLAPGQLSPVIKVGTGFAVVLLEAEHFPDDPQQWAAAGWTVLSARHNEELVRQFQLLSRKYASVDRKLLKKLDFEAKKPGLKALLADQRPLVRIQGERPVTVAELAREIQGGYFHGAEQAAKSKKPLNLRKAAALDNVMGRRLFLKEALARKIDETARFRYRMQDHESSLLVGAAVQRAVVPGIQVTEADERAYHQAHLSEYTTPRMLRLEGLVFGGEREAQAALKKLRAGTDFKFMAQNAEGRLDPEAAKLKFDGQVLGSAALPASVQKSLAGARTGEYRLHDEGAEHHVIHVIEEFPPSPQPFEEARGDIGKKVASEKLAQAVKDWIARLRQAYPVEVYLAGIGE